MKKYNTPEIVLQGFSFNDVITTSGVRTVFGKSVGDTYTENEISIYDYFVS